MKNTVLFLAIAFVLASCGKNNSSEVADIEEAAQQVGDVVASIDEVGGSGGSIAMLEPGIHQTFKRLGYGPTSLDYLFPNAYALSCGGSTFGSCTSNVVTRNFSGCTVGLATFTGTVTLTWGGTSSNCILQAASDTITRVPNFSVSGRRGATLTVTQSGTIGQRLTWASGTGTSKVFNFTNDGIRRAFTLSGSPLFDHTTSTTSPITVTGTLRSNRILNGGSLRVTNNLTGVTCDFVPSSVSWSTGCNCPVSGSWSASCSDGKTSSLTHTGCGTANFTLGSDSTAVTFDRCL